VTGTARQGEDQQVKLGISEQSGFLEDHWAGYPETLQQFSFISIGRLPLLNCVILVSP
jgi:hypothetical protein